VAALRAGDRAADAAPRSAAPLTASGSLSALREALELGTTVLIGYVDDQGSSSERVVDPVSVEGGTLVAQDHRSGTQRRFAVHRIASVQALPGDP
jgi:predicted DNA-binding transcriptional regulator YafY